MAKVSPKGKNLNKGCATGKAPGSREGSPVSSVLSLLPHHQPIKKTTHPAAPTPDFAYKNFPPKSLGSSGVLNLSHPLSLLGPIINLSPLQTLTFLFGLTMCQAHEPMFYNRFKMFTPQNSKGFIVQVGIVKFEMTKDPYNRFS